MKKTRSKYSAS